MPRTIFCRLLMLMMVTLIFISCQKELDFEPDDPIINPVPIDSLPPPVQTLLLTRIQQGVNPDLSKDSILLISYNNDKKINQIIDSLSNDTMKISYNNNGNPILAKNSTGISATFIYNSSQQLQEINYSVAGTNEKYFFEYASDGALSKKSYFSDLGTRGVLMLSRYYEYIVVAGNIRNMKEFTAEGTPRAERTYSYATQPSSFKILALLNIGNIFGFEPMMDINTYFNANLSSGFIWGATTGNTQYQFNSQQQPTKVSMTVRVPDDLLTWQFYYR